MGLFYTCLKVKERSGSRGGRFRKADDSISQGFPEIRSEQGTTEHKISDLTISKGM